MPLKQFVIKIHSRCDLACDHCYVYESADQSWHGRPKVMSDEAIAATAQRIAEHAKAHGLTGVSVVLHGGEPLLAGPATLERAIQALRGALDGVCHLDLRIHTNGVRLDEEFCELFARHGVMVGISLDGDRVANDRHRRYADGRSSYDQVIRAIDLLRTPRYLDMFAGLLCTIDIANDPIAVYESLVKLDPPRIDFLLPHATWDQPPPRSRDIPAGYADWLIAIYDRWRADGRPLGIRTFDSVIALEQGQASLTEAVGLEPSELVVIETDGNYEQVDSLKAAYPGGPVTGFDVFRHSLDMVGQHPGITARQLGLAGLCETCQACPVVHSCGGGLYTHRYRTGTGFMNPSVYCPDLLKLIGHVRTTVPPARTDQPTGGSAPGIPAAEFAELAAGFGGANAIRSLTAAQGTLRRTLLATVYKQAVSAPELAGAAGRLTGAWAVLARIDRENPVVLADVLAHPYIGTWAADCLEWLRKPATERASTAGSTAADLGYLGAIAAVAAFRAGIAAQVTVPVRHGVVHLPTLGRLITGSGGQAQAPVSTAIAQTAADAITVRTQDAQWRVPARADGGIDPPFWEPVRRLTARGISVALEDTDPYRFCHQLEAAPRLTEAQASQWQVAFGQAWEEILQDHAVYAPALAAGLRAIIPLSPGPAGRDVSATARSAFGALAVALPSDSATLALLMIHEFQHVKLGAVLDLCDLHDATDTRRFHAPWRPDPRPLEGLLQGTYAHVAVTDFWRARRRTASGRPGEAAEASFTHWRAQTADAIETLAGCGALTPLGERWVARMRESIAPMLQEPAVSVADTGAKPDA